MRSAATTANSGLCFFIGQYSVQMLTCQEVSIFFEQNSPVRITTHYLITDTFHFELCNTFTKIQLSV